jgi:hypothetical protein
MDDALVKAIAIVNAWKNMKREPMPRRDPA